MGIDLRSDTVTLQPSGMLQAMLHAEVGDDYYGGDRSVLELQDLAADILGKEQGLLVASGTMANLVAVLAHTNRGEAVLMDIHSHLFRAECDNISVLGGVRAYPLPADVSGIDVEALESAVRRRKSTEPPLTLLVVENTHNALGGVSTTASQMSSYRELSDAYDFGIHLDGARLFNASVALGVAPATLVASADSVTFCLSKGLAAPFGSVLVGSTEFIESARYYRQMVGGGLRQAGYLAAAGVWALRNMVERLAEDHALAKQLAEGLLALGCELDLATVQTNIVLFEPPTPIRADMLVQALSAAGISLNPPRNNRIRVVTHYGIDERDVDAFLGAMEREIGNVRG